MTMHPLQPGPSTRQCPPPLERPGMQDPPSFGQPRPAADPSPASPPGGAFRSPGTARPVVATRLSSKFENLVTRGFIARDQLAAAIVEAREQQVSVESLLTL